MDNTQKQLNDLEKRIKALEKPVTLSDEWKQALIVNGFFKADNVLTLLQGVSGFPREYLQGRIFNLERRMSIDPLLSRFYVQNGGDTIFSLNSLNPADQIFFASSGQLPSPLATGVAYVVLSADTDTFELDDGMGNAIIFTDTGEGTHFWSYDFL